MLLNGHPSIYFSVILFTRTFSEHARTSLPSRKMKENIKPSLAPSISEILPHFPDAPNSKSPLVLSPFSLLPTSIVLLSACPHPQKKTNFVKGSRGLHVSPARGMMSSPRLTVTSQMPLVHFPIAFFVFDTVPPPPFL